MYVICMYYVTALILYLNWTHDGYYSEVRGRLEYRIVVLFE